MAVELEKAKGTTLSSLSLTPLIDIVFLLLIFFLVVSKFEDEERELAVQVPTASEAKPLSSPPQQITVNVNQKGEYFVHHKLVSRAALKRILQEAAEKNPASQSVEIRGDGRTSWQDIITVINLCKAAGLERVSYTAE